MLDVPERLSIHLEYVYVFSFSVIPWSLIIPGFSGFEFNGVREMMGLVSLEAIANLSATLLGLHITRASPLHQTFPFK
ncbi:hypothetical protein DICVIV_03484 [Dictyocaulus viviparus]|uniref:Uncharacterized protein n=1 Tax=Dictyocaulus viviparus TaxID=29172 RepID=A0A0D8Y701_DICVI|nr:hypothetical protein DICVIV_03484 [Dictyocaulus viviparus]